MAVARLVVAAEAATEDSYHVWGIGLRIRGVLIPVSMWTPEQLAAFLERGLERSNYPVASASRPWLTHTVSAYEDGRLTCTCESWKYGHRFDAQLYRPFRCRHIKEWLASWEGQQTLARWEAEQEAELARLKEELRDYRGSGPPV